MTPINITVKSTSGSRYEMEIIEMAETISDFKVRLSEVSGIEAASQRLIFRGHILKDHLTFEDIRSKHGLESGHSMHVVSAPSKPSAASSTNAQATPATNNTSTPSATTPNTTNDNTASNRPSQQPMPNPFTGGLGGGGGGGGFGMGGGFPDMNEMQAQLRQNPEQMQAMLNHPMMESIMNNPELMRSFMMANPQIRQMMEQNPEMAHVFNDPATFRQMMQMARNPSLMSEMMRNTDRQMANIEMMPGGFDALRRMHENIQAPLMDAAQAGFGANGTPQNNNTNTNNNDNNNNNNDSANDNPFSTLFRNNNTPSNAPMPNPWAPNNNNGGSYNNNNNNNNDNNAANTNTNGAGFVDNPFASLFPGMATGTETGANTNANNTNTGTRGMPGIPNFGANGGVTDAMMDLLDNPAVQQIMEYLLADPATLHSMMEGNPQMQALVRENPQLASTLENPDLLRALVNPQVLRAARQLQNAMGTTGPQTVGQQTPQQQPTPTGENNNSANANNNNNNNRNNGLDRLEQMMEMFRSQLGTDGNLNNTNNNNNNNNNNGQPQPEPSQEELLETYRPQLSQLRDMGFLDESMCLQALRQARGDVSLAIENLLNRFG